MAKAYSRRRPTRGCGDCLHAPRGIAPRLRPATTASMADTIDVRKGQAPGKLGREAFGERFREEFYDPRFDEERQAIERLEAIAWRNYEESRKAPKTVKA